MVSIDAIKAPWPGSIAIGPFGSRLKSDCYVSDGVRVVRGTNLTGGKSFSGDFVFITPEKADELNSANLRPNDLVFPHRGAIGEVGVVPNDGVRYVMSSSLMKLTCELHRAQPDFIYYFFKSDLGRFELLKNSSQVGTPGIGQPLTSLRQIQLRLPPVREQKSISALLRVLDDRIALLRETNATLEAIAQALFKSWFVDFDPVRAKQQGLAPIGVDEAMAALFPDRFEGSALGPIPRGWRTGPILDMATLLSGGTPKTDRPEFWGGEIAWASAKDVSQSGSSVLVTTERTITPEGLRRSATRMIPRFATVVVARGATTGRMVMLGCEMAMNQTCYALTSRCDAPIALYCQLRGEIDALVNAAHGSVFDTITTNTFERSNVLQPPPNILACFEEVGRPIFERIVEATGRLRTLAMLRDTLLPRLISGQLRLPEAEALVEEAA